MPRKKEGNTRIYFFPYYEKYKHEPGKSATNTLIIFQLLPLSLSLSGCLTAGMGTAITAAAAGTPSFFFPLFVGLCKEK